METIPFETKGKYVCATPCPHRMNGKSGNIAYVGSGSCGECKYYQGEKEKAILCAFKDK